MGAGHHITLVVLKDSLSIQIYYLLVGLVHPLTLIMGRWGVGMEASTVRLRCRCMSSATQTSANTAYSPLFHPIIPRLSLLAHLLVVRPNCPWRIILDRLSRHATCPNHASFRRLTTDQGSPWNQYMSLPYLRHRRVLCVPHTVCAQMSST